LAVEFRILGPLEVRNERGPVALGGIKPRTVLAVLLLHPNESVHAERVAVALWGEDAPAGSTKTVQVYVSRLRKALGDPEVLVTTPAGYRLRVRAGELDAERFARLAEDGRRSSAAGQTERTAEILREALALWRGPALADLAFESFAQTEIARLEEQRLATLEARVDADLAAGRHADLVGELRQLVAANPSRERLAGQLMLALYRCGQQTDALEAFHAARRVLVDELGVEPGPGLRELQHAVLVHDPRLDAPLPTVAPLGDGAGALPAPPTVLFGREGDLHRVAVLVGEERTRLLTVVGPGGVGKTRLAIEAARRLAQDFRDGARFVSLASVAEPRDLASAIARTLSTPIREGEPATAALHRFLGDRHLLLVLDNFEHLLAAASLVSELLAVCPELTILLTSREPTRLAAERLYPVHPLDVPDARRVATAAELECYGATAMFVDRAQACNPGFVIDDANAPHVLEICRRLDGLPLALELAAARTGLLSMAELADRLDHALAVLTRGTRDAPERQRTLRATIDWSFGLLTNPEPGAFTQFAVFANGATVAAAESVTGASLDTLDSLVAKQLLMRRGDRLLMLQTVREYALERLAEHPEAGTIHDRLATWCLHFTRQAIPHLVQADRVTWLARLNAELPNVLAALSWALKHQRAQLALQLASDLGAYWWRTSQWEVGLPWIDATLEQSCGASTRAQAKALLCRARLISTRQQRRYRADLQASLELFRACDDDGGIAACLGHLANVEAWHGRFEKAAALSDEAMRFAVRTHDEEAIALALVQRVSAASGYDDVSSRTRTAIEHLQRAGNLYEVAHTCVLAGYLAIAERRYQDALLWLTEASDAGRQLGDAKSVFIIRSNQGLAWLFLNELHQAADAFDDALAVCREASCEHLVDEVLLGLAAIAARREQLARAAHLAGAAQAHRTASQAVSQVAVWSRLNDEMLTAPRETYGAENWDRVSAETASLTVYEAIDLARARERFAPATPGNTAPSPT
jgi:predicted ATPase/DNA-binding SARP family transcriptional activator